MSRSGEPRGRAGREEEREEEQDEGRAGREEERDERKSRARGRAGREEEREERRARARRTGRQAPTGSWTV